MAHRYKVIKDGPYPHFVTLSIIRWFPVFISGPYFRIIIDSLKHLQEHRKLSIHSYVIMPTHLHAIITAGDDDLSGIIRDFKKFTSREIYKLADKENNKLLTWMFEKAAEKDKDRRFRVWQDEFHPEVIYSQNVFLQKANYIHANPIRKGLAIEPNQWYYSSAAQYIDGKDGALDITWLDW